MAKLVYSEKDWKAESDCNTLMEAERIRRDPKRLAAAQKVAKEKLGELAAVGAIEPKMKEA